MSRAKNDAYLKNYFHDPLRTVDFFNATYFDGQQVIDDSLLDADSDSSIVITVNHQPITINRSRDILRQNDFIVMGIENQSDVDSTMPLRMMEYDSYQYRKQINKGQKSLKPILSEVLYTGEEKWRGPEKLSEMLKIPTKYINERFNDWKGNVFDIKELDVTKFKNRDNRLLVEGIQRLYKWNKDIKILEGMKQMPKEVALVIAEVTKMKEVLKYIEEEKGEEIDMCKSIESYGQDKLNEGIEQERIANAKAMLENGISTDVIVKCIQLPIDKIKQLQKELTMN